MLHAATLHTKNCRHCGKHFTFTSKHRNAAYCGMECAASHRRKAPKIKICPACLGQYLSPCRKSVYCSHKCYAAHLRSMPGKTVQQLLEGKYEIVGECWVWTGYIEKNGYGRAYAGDHGTRKTMWAHIFVYHVLVGPTPPGLELDHKCRNRSCVNPDHLELVTHLENVRRGVAFRTQCKHGHPYGISTPTDKHGSRICLMCRADHNAALRQRRRLARQARAQNQG